MPDICWPHEAAGKFHREPPTIMFVKLFDGFSEGFDDSLQKLAYRAPEMVGNVIA